MDSRSLHDTPYAWLRLALTLLIACIGNVGMWAVIVVLPDLQGEFAIDRATASLPYTACMVGFAFGSLLIGRYVDRFGIALSLAVAISICAAGFALAAVTASITVVILLHAAIGFGSASAFAPLIADISHWFLRRRGIAVAITASGNYLSGAIWPLILSGVQADAGWRGVYLMLAVILPVTVLPLCLTLRRRLPQDAADRADEDAAVRARAVALPRPVFIGLLFLAGIACCVAMSMPQVHIVALCVDLGFGPAVGAEMLSLMLLGGVVSRLISGVLADRIGGIRTLLIGSVLQGITLALYLPAGGLVSLYMVSLLFGLGQGGIVPSYSIVVREYLPSHIAGSFVGLLTFATIIGMAFGGWISGIIYDLTGSYWLAIVNGIGWNLLNVSIMVGILWVSRRRMTPA